MTTPLRYLLSYDVTGTIDRHPIDHVTGEHLNADRLEHAEFIILALNGPVAVGMVIAERPRGIPGFQWLRNVGDVLEVGGLFVDPAYRRAEVATKLTDLAVTHVRALRLAPVGVTEVGSVAYEAARRSDAEARRGFTVDGREYVPWIL